MSKGKPKKGRGRSPVKAQASPAQAPEVPETLPLWKAVGREYVAIGIALVIFFRPWRDGLTYPAFNTYFLWATVFLTGLWGFRLLLRGERVRFGAPIALFSAYLFIAWVTGFGTVQYDATHRALLFWTGYLFLFVLCTNALRTRMAVGIVLGAYIVSVAANALWAVLHYEYMLPLMREQLAQDPALLRRFFGTEVLTAELKRRLEVNRAFGSLLFPNALAAFLILSIPYLVGEMWPTARDCLKAWRSVASGILKPDSRERLKRQFASAVAGLTGWFITFAASFFLYPFLLAVVSRDDNWLGHPVQAGLYLGVIPFGAGAACLVLTRMGGLHLLRVSLQALIIPFAVCVECLALYLTFSRGGAVAFVGGTGLAAFLFVLGSDRVRRRIPFLRATAAAAAILVGGVFLAGAVTSAEEPHETPVATGGELGTIHATVQAAPPPLKPLKPLPKPKALETEGTDIVLFDMLNMTSLNLRLSYWKVAMTMAADNFWTGVGLGNFGTVYAKYQYLGAGDVQTAHNDYLQTWCETGVFGFMALVGFWLYFAIWGARRILLERDPQRRWMFAGFYGGIMCFLFHSLTDFNFYNPALVSLVFFMTGVFYTRATLPESGEEDARPKSIRYQILAVPLLLLVSMVTGAGAQVYLFDFTLTDGTLWGRIANVGSLSGLRQRVDMARFLLKEVHEEAYDPENPPYRPYVEVITLIPDHASVAAFGTIRVPRPGNPPSLRPLARGEAPPFNTLVFITDRAAARRAAANMSEVWLERLKLTDDIYPHSPATTMRMYEWYDLLQAQAEDVEKKGEYVDQCLAWAEEGVRRNSEQAWFHNWYGKALWLKASQLIPGDTSLEYYRRGLDEYRKARDLYPISPVTWSQYATASKKLGNAFVSAGREPEGRVFIAEGDFARIKSQELQRTRNLLYRQTLRAQREQFKAMEAAEAAPSKPEEG